jgi:hypothetical protein
MEHEVHTLLKRAGGGAAGEGRGAAGGCAYSWAAKVGSKHILFFACRHLWRCARLVADVRLR